MDEKVMTAIVLSALPVLNFLTIIYVEKRVQKLTKENNEIFTLATKVAYKAEEILSLLTVINIKADGVLNYLSNNRKKIDSAISELEKSLKTTKTTRAKKQPKPVEVKECQNPHDPTEKDNA